METENRKAKVLEGAQKEVADAPEESMEDWFNRGVGDIEEGEVVRGRVVEVRDSEVLVDIGYKSEGTIAMEEFRHAGTLPKVGDEIEVYLESKEDSEGLIVLSKDKISPTAANSKPQQSVFVIRFMVSSAAGKRSVG